MIMTEKIMPSNVEVEKCVIGSMFLSDQACKKCIENLSSELFYLVSHQRIFDVIKTLSESNKKIDVALVTSELDKRNILDEVGGVAYISEIVTSVPSASNVDEYINLYNKKSTEWWIFQILNYSSCSYIICISPMTLSYIFAAVNKRLVSIGCKNTIRIGIRNNFTAAAVPESTN